MPPSFPLRGEIYTVDFGAAGGRLLKPRPAVIVQNDKGNRHSSETIVVGIRSGPVAKILPIHVAVPAGDAGLSKESFVDCGHLMTISRDQLGRRWGVLLPETMEKVDLALRVSLGL